ncbi:hypothetical protein ELH77_19115 [Rhizobium ruizarguesonis]|uniref:hypothetical protein n=1 Tax=Rhizobium ruizarguesonis TaxID=2081791 RepID=UPI0010F2E914|nr:hypothetical protein [Rhizobium ruizarguesonis]TAZ20717.1 hypothetical protein ELH77_19115 [Rhizobium ruizarguesonis]
MKHYILLPNRMIARATLMAWATWFEFADRHVAQTETELHLISTVFLGIDHNFSRKGPPVLFETMVFVRADTGDVLPDEFFRYSSWDDAEAGHRTTVRRVLKAEAAAAKTVKEERAFNRE